MNATGLQCEYGHEPLGLDVERPRFSWRIEDDRPETMQGAYQVQVSRWSGESFDPSRSTWDSGRVHSSASGWVTYDGDALEPMTRYAWRIRASDQQGEVGEWSASDGFETGRKRRPWTGRWIGAASKGSLDASAPPPLVRRAFQLESQPRRARLYVTALGLYECRVNGTRVGDSELRPGWTDYSRRVVYDTYDVTEQLRPGENVLGAMLGDGWYCGRIAWFGRHNYGDLPKLLAELRVTLANGEERVVSTDEQWQTSSGPLIHSDLLDGEMFDARLERAGWDRPGANTNSWPSAQVFEEPADLEIVAPVAPPVRVIQVIPAEEIPAPDASLRLYDLGQNIAGRVRIRLRGGRGATVRLRHAEMLQEDGHLYTENLRSAAATDWHILRGGGEETYEPRFTFHGFRYVEVHSPERHEADVLSVEGLVLHNDMPVTGAFECSDELVNQLFSNQQWGHRDNYLEVLTDCPQRDERLGWTGDAQVFVATACYNMDVSGFMAKWMQDLRDAQADDGRYPKYAPDPARPGIDGGPAWSEAGAICAWRAWLHYGDQALLEDHYQSMCRFAAFLDETSDDGIRPTVRGGVRAGYGDWLALDTASDSRRGGTPSTLIGTAYHLRTVDLMAKIADVLGQARDAETYRDHGQRLRTAFERRFVAGDSRLEGHTQTAYLLALGFDLLPERQRSAAMAHLLERLGHYDNHLSTGFVGTPLLCPVLTRFGQADLAYRLLMNRSYPSWLYSVLQGATTMWERWNSYTKDGGFGPADMNSFNHYAYGAIGQWLYETVLGIAPMESHPGFERFTAKPIPGGGLSHSRGHVDTMRGRIEAGWQIEDGCFRYELTVPPNTTAELTMPFAEPTLERSGARQNRHGHWVLELPPGRHTYTQRLPV